MRCVLLLVTASVALAACAPVQPPTAAPAPEARQVRLAASVDDVWRSAVGFFADANIPIQTIDKASGILAAQRIALGPEQRLAWMNCGTANGKSVVAQANNVMRGWASVNVFVQPAGDSTQVRVNVAVDGERMNPFAGNSYTPDRCVSTGELERGLLAAIQKGVSGTR